MKRNIKLTIEYDGTDFFGWQRQPFGRTVQEVIEKSLSTITQEEIEVVGAGRTDSGVHARGQVANYFTVNSMALYEIHRALNGILPEDVVIRSVEEVDVLFSARFNATEREYRYYISKAPSAIDRKYQWQLGYEIDIEKMNRAAALLIGTKDFQAFCKSGSDVKHYQCRVIESGWSFVETKLIYTIRANRFLHGMVRALVGTMVNVGRGHTREDEFIRILESKDRSQSGQAAPAHGLFLERVTY